MIWKWKPTRKHLKFCLRNINQHRIDYNFQPRVKPQSSLVSKYKETSTMLFLNPKLVRSSILDHTNRFINYINRSYNVYGNFTLKTPVLVRSPKLATSSPVSIWMGDRLGIPGAVDIFSLSFSFLFFYFFDIFIYVFSSKILGNAYPGKNREIKQRIIIIRDHLLIWAYWNLPV